MFPILVNGTTVPQPGHFSSKVVFNSSPPPSPPTANQESSLNNASSVPAFCPSCHHPDAGPHHLSPRILQQPLNWSLCLQSLDFIINSSSKAPIRSQQPPPSSQAFSSFPVFRIKPKFLSTAFRAHPDLASDLLWPPLWPHPAISLWPLPSRLLTLP